MYEKNVGGEKKKVVVESSQEVALDYYF